MISQRTFKPFMILLCISFLSTSVLAQLNKPNKQPKKDIKVNREYDENGNLTRYDSTYVYTWSSDSTFQIMNDSSFFREMDMSKMQKRMQEQLNRFFGPDSLRQNGKGHPFFSDDFFNNDFFDTDFFDSQMFRRNFNNRDSSQNDFYKEFDEMIKKRRHFRQEHNSKMQRELDSLKRDFLEQRQKYYQQRDSIYRKHNRMQNNSIDL
jgi:hypothetical protein